MHAETVIHSCMKEVMPWMHSKRREAVEAVVGSAIRGGKIAVTSLGRAMRSEAKEKHCIKRADRLLSNNKLRLERFEVYRSLVQRVIGKSKQIVILVDWSDINEREKLSVLRASTPLQGRALTLYEEVHGGHGKNQREIHRNFLRKLKEILPEGCHAIIVTDAGFFTPWFREVEKHGWDFIGRVRGARLIQVKGKKCWESCKILFKRSTRKAKDLGQAVVAKSNPISCRLIIFKARQKGRTKKNLAGVRTQTSPDKHYAKRGKEPWLLATSLDNNAASAKQIVKLYASRMQIEEAFRDLKSMRYGFSLRFSGTYKKERLQILLLIATIATYILWLLGKASELLGVHRHYQANTVTKTAVLSTIFLGAQVAHDSRVRIRKKHIVLSARSLHKIINQYAANLI